MIQKQTYEELEQRIEELKKESFERKRAEEELKKYRDYLEVKVKDATEELREAHDFQENLIESSIDAIIGIDREGTLPRSRVRSRKKCTVSTTEYRVEWRIWRWRY